MSTIQVDNLEGYSYNNGKIQLTGDAQLNVQGTMEVDTTGQIVIPRGKTSDRPSSPADGMIRFNTDTNVVEIYLPDADGEGNPGWKKFTSSPPGLPIPLRGGNSAPAINDGLVIYYNALVAASIVNGSTELLNIADNNNIGSENLHNGTLINGPTVREGRGINFDGIDDIITFTIPNYLRGEPITIEMWCDFRQSGNASGGYSYFAHINGFDTTIGNSYFGMCTNSSNFITSFFNGEWPSMTTQIQAGAGNVAQIVSTWDGLTQRTYVNGILRTSRALTAEPQNWTNQMSIGGARTAPSYRPALGRFQQFMVYDKALSAVEVKANYNAIAGPQKVYAPQHLTNAVLYLDAGNLESYPGSGTTWYDLSDSGYDVTLTNITYEDTTSDHGGALILNGVDSFARTGTITEPALETISFWVYNNTTFNNNNGSMGGPSTYQSLVNVGNTYMVNLGGWTSAATNEAVHIWYGSGGVDLTYTADEEWAAGNWWNMVFNWNTTTSKYDIWRNGVKLNTYQGTGGGAGKSNVSSNYLEFFTSNSQTYTFYGKCAQIVMYDIALTDDEVIENYQSMRGRFGL